MSKLLLAFILRSQSSKLSGLAVLIPYLSHDQKQKQKKKKTNHCNNIIVIAIIDARYCNKIIGDKFVQQKIIL